MPSSPSRSPVTNLTKGTDLLTDYLRLRGNANTSRNYRKSLADFCRRIYDSDVSIVLLTQYLDLPWDEGLLLELLMMKNQPNLGGF